MTARSARGVLVDFDLLKVKQSIADAPKVDVAAREDFVERRIRRRTKRADVAPQLDQMTASPVTAVQSEPEAVQPEAVQPEDFEPSGDVQVKAVKPVKK